MGACSSQSLKSAIKFFGSLAWRHDALTQHTIGKYTKLLIPLLKKGDLLTTHIESNFSNWLIKGKFTHIAVYFGIGTISADTGLFQTPGTEHIFIQATGDRGVHYVTLEDLIRDKHGVCLLDNTLIATQQDQEKFCFTLGKLIGKNYDYFFDDKNDDYYCSELVTICLLSVIPFSTFNAVMGQPHFLGRFLPDDYVQVLPHKTEIILLRDFETTQVTRYVP